MKFFYTGASTYNVAQPVASLSLGGFLSSSEVQNDILNNLFSSISDLSKQNLKREAKLIAIKNTYNEAIQDVTVTFNTADWSKLITEYDIAFVASKEDDCGNIYFDGINNSEALPYVTFESITEADNEFSIGDLAIGQVIGAWLVRKIVKAQIAPISCNQLYANYLGTTYTDPSTNVVYTPITVEEQENITIALSWDDDQSQSDSV